MERSKMKYVEITALAGGVMLSLGVAVSIFAPAGISAYLGSFGALLLFAGSAAFMIQRVSKDE